MLSLLLSPTKIKILIYIFLVFIISCKSTNVVVTKLDNHNVVSFNWETLELNGKMREKAAISVPFIIGNIPYKFNCQLDLGSYHSILYENSIQALKNKHLEFANSIVTDKESSNVTLETIHLGEFKIHHHQFQLYEDYGDLYTEEDYQTENKCNICTIGSDVFTDQKLIIDYPNQILEIVDTLVPDQKSQFVFTPINFDAGFIKITLLIGGKKEQFLFDTGSSLFSLIVSPKQWDKYRDISAPIDTLTVTSWGESYNIFGSPINTIVSTGKLSIHTNGHRVYSNHLYSDFFESQNISGIVGNAFFLDKKIVVDYDNMLLGIGI